MKIVTLFMIILLALLQYRLWSGNGSLTDVHHLEQIKQDLQDETQRLQLRNHSLAAEVNDLKHGNDAIEERARTELGMVKKGEAFYQIVQQPKPVPGQEQAQ